MAALSPTVEAEITALSAAGSDISSLVTYCEQFELNLGHQGLAPAASNGVYKVHLAAHLMCEQLDEARFLWKRVPGEQRDQDPEFVALWAVGKAMWVKDMAGAQAAMAAHAWTPPLLSGLLERMQREHLARSFAQCARAYSHISAEQLSATLGVPPAKVAALADAANWTTDAETGAYMPAPVEEQAGTVEMRSQLKILTDYVAHVERELKA